MKYNSTRGGSTGLTFEEAVLQGLSPDGGLYIPERIPTVSQDEILSWRSLPFADLAAKIMRHFVDRSEISDEELLELTRRSYSSFSHPDVVPVKNLDGLWVLELFHGPTFAFKDVALQLLGNLFEFFLKRKSDGRILTVVGATSGDTGGAAIYGLRGKKDINVFILHPAGRISSVQEQQMTSVLDGNVNNIALEGTFDDCQDIVKALFSDEAFRAKYSLGAVNSINWARILAQTTYYFHCVFQLMKDSRGFGKVQFSVPTGNFGDILAGFYAQQMGLPIHRLIIATNENDILHRFLETGRYHKPNSDVEAVKMTLAPAMDILVSSNFERLMFYLSCGNINPSQVTEVSPQTAAEASQRVKAYMTKLKEEGGFTADPVIVERAKQLFAAHRVDDAQVTETISRYYHQQSKYILDPHTAIGVVAAEHILKQEKGVQTVCLATASPGKFPEAVLEAINSNPPSSAVQSGFTGLQYKDIAPSKLVELVGLPKRVLSIKTQGDKQKGLQLVRSSIQQTLGF